MLNVLRQRAEWKFFAALPKADAGQAAAWWLVLLLRGVLPAVSAARGRGRGVIRSDPG